MRIRIQQLLHFFLPFVLILLLLYYFITSLTTLGNDHASENKNQLQQAITRATVACYAAEGIYPPDLNYLKDHYGIQINDSLYVIQYEYIASNLMPDITVLEIQE